MSPVVSRFVSVLSPDIRAVISFYSSTIFENVGYTQTQALYASLGYGAIQVVFTIPTLFLIDTKGRRTLTLIVSPSFLFPRGIQLTNPPLYEDFPPHVHLFISRRPISPEGYR